MKSLRADWHAVENGKRKERFAKEQKLQQKILWKYQKDWDQVLKSIASFSEKVMPFVLLFMQSQGSASE